MYLVIIAWLYVTVLMAVAEATASNGSILGALATFVLYGLGPVALVVYLMRTPQRRRAMRAREAALEQPAPNGDSTQPDAGGHAPAASEHAGISAVRKEP